MESLAHEFQTHINPKIALTKKMLTAGIRCQEMMIGILAK
jgi:hypothetical protein